MFFKTTHYSALYNNELEWKIRWSIDIAIRLCRWGLLFAKPKRYTETEVHDSYALIHSSIEDILRASNDHLFLRGWFTTIQHHIMLEQSWTAITPNVEQSWTTITLMAELQMCCRHSQTLLQAFSNLAAGILKPCLVDVVDQLHSWITSSIKLSPKNPPSNDPFR